MKKKGRIENNIHFILTIGNRYIINKGFKNYYISILKPCLLFLIFSFLFIFVNNVYSIYKENKQLNNDTLKIESEIEYLKEKKHDMSKYQKKINNLLGYEIYKDYLKNNRK